MIVRFIICMRIILELVLIAEIRQVYFDINACIWHECGFVTRSGKLLKHKVIYPCYFGQFLVSELQYTFLQLA